jgi:hypothetical protein
MAWLQKFFGTKKASSGSWTIKHGRTAPIIPPFLGLPTQHYSHPFCLVLSNIALGHPFVTLDCPIARMG